MRVRSLAILLLVLWITGCGTANVPAVEHILISGAGFEQRYALEELKAMKSSRASFEGVEYIGVPLKVLLQEAGFDLSSVLSVKVIAADGYSVTYDADLIQRDDTLVAYGRSAGPLARDEGTLRMVLSGEEGKLNVRHLVELEVNP